MTNDNKVAKGGCLCGAVQYEVYGPLRDVVNCHCTLCLKLHGNFGPHTKAKKTDIKLTNDSGLAWFQTSEIARRGFCNQCGSNLFWEPYESDATGILAGTLNSPAGLKTIGHIFVSEKPDFYDITDDYPQFPKSSNGRLPGDFR